VKVYVSRVRVDASPSRRYMYVHIIHVCVGQGAYQSISFSFLVQLSNVRTESREHRRLHNDVRWGLQHHTCNRELWSLEQNNCCDSTMATCSYKKSAPARLEHLEETNVLNPPKQYPIAG
jgi:hypothetical protein